MEKAILNYALYREVSLDKATKEIQSGLAEYGWDYVSYYANQGWNK